MVYCRCGTHFAPIVGMSQRSLLRRMENLEERVEKLEGFQRDFDKTLEKHFRAQAEMLDERFAQVDARFVEMDKKWDLKLEAKFDEKLAPIHRDLTILREGMKIILTKIDKKRR
jgi:hypothetical protein